MIDKFVVGETYVYSDGIERTVSAIRGHVVYFYEKGWSSPGRPLAIVGDPLYLRLYHLVDNKSNVCEDWS